MLHLLFSTVFISTESVFASTGSEKRLFHIAKIRLFVETTMFFLWIFVR